MSNYKISQLNEKQNNILKLLKAVFNNPESLTVDIKKMTGLSISTVSRVIIELRQKNLIKAAGKEKIKKGRFPQKMSFNSQYGSIIHLDIKPDGIHGCAAYISGRIIDKQYKSFTEDDLPLDYLLGEMKSMFDSLKESAKTKVLAAGISLPGIADEKKKIVSRIPDISAFNNIDVFSYAEQALSVPVIINNVPGVAAVGERIANYPNSEDVVYLNIMQSIGIGAGIIIGGKLIKGKDYIAGEAGDFYFDRNSFSSVNRNSVGRLEEYAGLSALFKRVNKLIKDGGAANMRSLLKEHELDISMIERSIEAGDKDLEALYLDVLKVWAILIIDIVLLLNPERIVIGGAVSSKNKYTQRIINKILSEELFIDQGVELAKSGENAVFIGGIELLRNYVFDNIIAKDALENI